MSRSNPLALAVLTCLIERPMHPYEIAQTLRDRAKDENIRLNYGSLYGVVESLAKRGLIVATETVREGRRPERTIYAVTDIGRRESTDWLTDLLATPVKEYLQFEAGLTLLGALPPDDALDALRQRLRRLDLAMLHSEAAAKAIAGLGLPRLFTLEGEYVQALLQAELDFVRRLVSDLETGAIGGMDGWRELHQRPPDGPSQPAASRSRAANARAQTPRRARAKEKAM